MEEKPKTIKINKQQLNRVNAKKKIFGRDERESKLAYAKMKTSEQALINEASMVLEELGLDLNEGWQILNDGSVVKPPPQKPQVKVVPTR